jgi:DHA1 family multidrug resistance protein-like MFS transporter
MSKNRRDIIILFFTLVVVMLGFGIVIPILPFYIDSFGASGRDLGLLMSSFAAMQFIFAPIWGSLSDQYGRKPILIIGVLGNGLSHLLFGLSTQLWMLFASRIMAGILSSATMPTAMAYIGDSTSEEERGGGMGIMNAAIGVGVIFGPGLGGWLAADSLSLPFFLAAALSTFALFPILIALPESLPPEKRTDREIGVRGIQFTELWKALFGPIGFLLILAFLLSFGLTSFEGIFGLYALKIYGYGPKTVGTIIVIIGIIMTIMQGVLTGPLSKRWGEAKIIQVSLIVSAVGFVLMLQAKTFQGVLLTVNFFIIGNSLLRPAVSSLISKRASGGQGKAMGWNNSFMSLGRIIGPMLAGFLFDIKTSYPYLNGSSIMLMGFIASLLWLKDTPPPSKHP